MTDTDIDYSSLTNGELMGALRAEHRKIEEHIKAQDDLLSYAWTIIANAHGGDWDQAKPDWHLAAITWRDRFHELGRE